MGLAGFNRARRKAAEAADKKKATGGKKKKKRSQKPKPDKQPKRYAGADIAGDAFNGPQS